MSEPKLPMNPQERHCYNMFSDGLGDNLLGVDLSYRGFLSCVSGYLEKASRLERLTAGAGASPLDAGDEARLSREFWELTGLLGLLPELGNRALCKPTARDDRVLPRQYNKDGKKIADGR